ncbi:hypothetical protein KXQ82_09990 [Mucilaginibacter sp. HMF5004]|uniref:hypothetical protein n=1 Tax=Mucilaginibacter rivuli TaxID=2857527 RepID=UPI001C5D292C|nr:hypothetical protein [Mucilaginibacter rivuli]MBW4890048.1 hypothetical protein [Mucilaginibacter rivuli]
MRNRYLFLLIIILFTGCKHPRKVSTSFYYWKTVYKQNPAESEYPEHLHSNKMYVRIMDVDMDDSGINPVPVSPIAFQQKLPDAIQIVPVVFIVNNAFKIIPKTGLADMAAKIVRFVDAKVTQAGKKSYSELQIDCDWTADTKDNYFYLLNEFKTLTKGKTLSITLRLHQIKNQKNCGIPPVNKALLMCYNMGNLRKYGPQNSIIEVTELKKYLGDNLTRYPIKMDIGLPLFSWAVAFRDKQYIGIARQINFNNLNNGNMFSHTGANMYFAKTDMPQFGLKKNDEVRWEDVPLNTLHETAAYISPRLKEENIEVVYFHLDENLLKKYTYDELENVAKILR